MSGFDSTPAPRFLKGLQNQHWRNGVVGALAEFVDNSFDPARGNAKRVDISWSPKDRTMVIVDDGEGMNTVGPLFKLGEGEAPAPGNIGVYGNGGKLALLWLARDVRVVTLRKGFVNQHALTWRNVFEADHFPVISMDWEKADLNTCPKALLARHHGTYIELKVPRARAFDASKARRDLAAKYAPGLRDGLKIVWTTHGKNGGVYDLGDLVEAPAEPLEEIQVEFVLEHQGEHLPVRGKIGLYPDLSYNQSKIAIGFGYRQLRTTRDCYRSPDGDESYTGTGVAGYLDLIEWPASYLSQTKEGIDDAEVWAALMAELFEIAQPLLKQVDEEEMWAEFDDLALDLENLLGEGGHRIDVSILASTDEEGDLRIAREHRGKKTIKPERSQPASPDPDGMKAQKEEAKRARIKIVRMSDTEIGGVLSKALEPKPDEVAIGVNKDHPFVRAALNPPNRLAFNLLITREIATLLARDKQLLEAAFPPRVRRVLPEENGDRERWLQRLLVERARDLVEA